MGRWGAAELPAPTRDVVGVMTHLATADIGPRLRARPARALPRGDRAAPPHLTRHAANSAAALRLPEARFDAARCGIALYGLSPFGTSRGRRRARAGALVAQRARAHAAPPARRVDRLRPPLRRRARDVDRDRPGRLRGRLPPRPHRHRGARRRRAPARRRRRLDGRVRRRARPRAAARHAGDDRRRRRSRSRSTRASPARSPTSSRRRIESGPTARDAASSPAPEPPRAARERARAAAPGPTTPARYQRGTKISRRSWSTASRIRPTTNGGSTTSRPRERARAACAAGSPGVSTKPGLTVSTEMPRRPSSTATAREKRAARASTAEYGPSATVPATETTLTTCEPGPRPGRNACSAQTEPR